MNKYEHIYNTAIEKDWNIKYDILFKDLNNEDGLCLAIQNIWNPISIKQREFNFINNFVRKHNLKNGYELATGVGISCLAFSIDNPNSRLITMDCYIEENTPGGSKAYCYAEPTTYKNSNGWKSVNQLIKYFNLEENIIPVVGWSPIDTDKAISTLYRPDEKLDYIFIDAQHYDEFVLADLKSIEQYINRDRFALFIHDTHAFTNVLDNYLIETYGKTYQICDGCDYRTDMGFNLSIVTNIV